MKNENLKRWLCIFLALALVVSIGGNIIQYASRSTNEGEESIWHIDFSDANSRENYFTVHNIAREKYQVSGKGVKVGVLDWCFNYDNNQELYAGGKNFSKSADEDYSYHNIGEHGFWMATTLKEIAPDVEVYALGVSVCMTEKERVDSLIDAIDWAIENEMDILTYSQPRVPEEEEARYYAALEKAHNNGIITTFIHCYEEGNILPDGLFDDPDEEGVRRSDINIFTYDYNTIFINDYESFFKSEEENKNEKDSLFMSISSTSVVTAGMIAMLMEVNPNLTSDQYRDLLIETSRPYSYNGHSASRVVDFDAAIQQLGE